MTDKLHIILYFLLQQMSFSSNTSSGYSLELPDPPGDLFNIISVQSSSRPGCIIELDAFTDAQQVPPSLNYPSLNNSISQLPNLSTTHHSTTHLSTTHLSTTHLSTTYLSATHLSLHSEFAQAYIELKGLP